MTSVPRITRAAPADEQTWFEAPIPVIARLCWQSSGHTEDAKAWLLATSPRDRAHIAAALIVWLDRGTTRMDWIPATEVRHPGQPYAGVPHLPFLPKPLPLRPGIRPGPPIPTSNRRGPQESPSR